MILFLTGCGSYRIERHRRSPIYFNEKFIKGDIIREVTLDDGTLLIFEPTTSQNHKGRSGRGATFKIREETEEGEIILRALLPQHVIMNLLNCLRNEEYELIYDQLLAKKARDSYESGHGYNAFASYMQRHRMKLAQWLTRIIAGFPQQHVIMDPIGGDITRCRLRRQIAQQFTFKSLDVIREDGEFRLLMIR